MLIFPRLESSRPSFPRSLSPLPPNLEATDSPSMTALSALLPLFSPDSDKGSSQLILGFEKVFLSKLTTEGFPDLKTLVKYRKQFKSLSDLINT